jgi:hypothetical protein
MQVYRGHKGRVEMKVTAKGRSAHAASNFLGDNAIYKLLPIIAGIRDLDPHLRTHEFLGKGTITVTDMKVSTASINAVPDEATIYIDRRVTFGSTMSRATPASRWCWINTSPPGRWKNRTRWCRALWQPRKLCSASARQRASGTSALMALTGPVRRASRPSVSALVTRFTRTL